MFSVTRLHFSWVDNKSCFRESRGNTFLFFKKIFFFSFYLLLFYFPFSLSTGTNARALGSPIFERKQPQHSRGKFHYLMCVCEDGLTVETLELVGVTSLGLKEPRKSHKHHTIQLMLGTQVQTEKVHITTCDPVMINTSDTQRTAPVCTEEL